MERTELERWKAREVARLLALVETERRYYQEIVASVPVGLLVLAPDLSVVSSNREVRKMCGLRSGEAVGPRLEALFPPETFDKVREVLATDNSQNDVMVDTQEEPVRHLRISIQAIRTWDDEKEQEALVTIQEIPGLPTQALAGTTASQPEELHGAALPVSELLQNLDAVVWVAELPGLQFLYVNEKAQELLGYPAEKWLNTPEFWKERIHPQDRDAILKGYEEAIEKGSRHSCEYRAETSTGKVLWLRESARLMVDEHGKTKHLIGIAVEVTQRRILEDQVVRAQRVDALGKLGSRVSREIQNLLMVVSGYGEELIHGLPSSHPLNSDLQEILSATDRLRSLSNQLSLFSRRPSSQAAPVDLSIFMDRLQPAVQNVLGDKVYLDVRMSPASLSAEADEAQLEQLVLALAQRSRPDMNGGGTFSIECSPLEITEDLRGQSAVLRPGSYLAISIKDNGPTLDAEARAAMFESLGTLRDSKDDRDAKDIPAVLARVYGSVRQWGGDISVYPNTPHGTVVEVFLHRIGKAEDEPADQAGGHAEGIPEPIDATEPAPATEPEVAEEPVPVPKPVHETILIAEEDAGIRALVKKILKRQNYVVLEAATAEEALKAAEEQGGKVDLLIADIAALQFNGTGLAKKITAQYPQAKVLYLSGYTDDPTAKSVEVPEHAAYLQKPFTLGSLLNKVREVLEAKPE